MSRIRMMRLAISSLLSVLAVAIPVSANDWGAGVSYTYDGSGNIRQIGTDFQVYDTAGRLVRSDTNGVRTSFEYDAFGNRTRCQRPLTDCQPFTVTAAKNQIQGATYNAAGNVTQFEGHTYTYDAVNMPTRDVVNGSGFVVEYIYTADDERIAVYTATTGNWRWTLRDASGKVLRELASRDPASGTIGTSSWSWIKDYVYRDGLLLASRQIEPGQTTATTYRYHLDHLGTPRRITDASNQIVGQHNYHAFGPETNDGQNEPSLTPLKYTGHERDGDLDYMHARYYDPDMGRFLSVDPGKDWDLRQPQSWNMYAYVRNNPINRVDPTGRCGEDAKFIGPGAPCAATSSETKPKAEPRTVQPEPAGGPPVAVPGAPDSDWKFNPDPQNPRGGTYGPTKPRKGHGGGKPSASWEGGAHVPHWDVDDGKGNRRRYRGSGEFLTPEEAHGHQPPKRTATLSPGELVGAIGLAIFGTAITIMTGGAAALQPSGAGLIIVPTTFFAGQL